MLLDKINKELNYESATLEEARIYLKLDPNTPVSEVLYHIQLAEIDATAALLGDKNERN